MAVAGKTEKPTKEKQSTGHFIDVARSAQIGGYTALAASRHERATKDGSKRVRATAGSIELTRRAPSKRFIGKN
jgi:hypothetical protein